MPPWHGDVAFGVLGCFHQESLHRRIGFEGIALADPDGVEYSQHEAVTFLDRLVADDRIQWGAQLVYHLCDEIGLLEQARVLNGNGRLVGQRGDGGHGRAGGRHR